MKKRDVLYLHWFSSAAHFTGYILNVQIFARLVFVFFFFLSYGPHLNLTCMFIKKSTEEIL